MITTTPQTSFDYQKKYIHVFLGRGDCSNLTINVLAPYHPEIREITCTLTCTPFSPIKKTVPFKDEIIRFYQFEFEGLLSSHQYSYSFSSNGADLDLGGGLKAEDLYFDYWSELSEADSLIQMSCNGVFFFKDENNKWGMWERLLSEIETSQTNPKLLVLGGDQYYQDEVEFDWLDKLDNENFVKVKNDFKRASLENALKHWENLSYRKIMARIPSIAMLDDHDITDGANGDRKKLYIGETPEFNQKWINYLSVQTELFSILQASRNPSPSVKKVNSAFSFILDLGDTALVALDLRTEKNARKRILMEEDSKLAIFQDIRNLKHKNVMILIPVVPVKNSSAIEGLVLTMTKTASTILESFKPKTKVEEKLHKGTSFVADLEDDLTDALCSDVNRDFLFELLNLMMDKSKESVKYSILSGDIHTAGTVELHLHREAHVTQIPILISSPIAYEPMNFIVEASLREKKEINLTHSGIHLKAINNAFTTNRNFMEIYPSKLLSCPNEAVFIYEEGIEGSKVVLTNSWRRTRSHAIQATPVIMSSMVDREISHN